MKFDINIATVIAAILTAIIGVAGTYFSARLRWKGQRADRNVEVLENTIDRLESERDHYRKRHRAIKQAIIERYEETGDVGDLIALLREDAMPPED